MLGTLTKFLFKASKHSRDNRIQKAGEMAADNYSEKES